MCTMLKLINYEKVFAVYNFIILTTTIFHHALCRYGYLDYRFHYETLLLYTKIDFIFILNNPRVYSLFIHHLVTIHILYAVLKYPEFTNYSNLCLLELTSVFGSLNTIFKTRTTLFIRNASWIIIRLCLLPYFTYELLSAVLYTNSMLYTRYGHSIITLLILSLEWTNELLKLNINCISQMYYIIPIVYQIHIYQYTKVVLTCIYWSFFYFKVSQHIDKYENRLLFNFTTSYLLLM